MSHVCGECFRDMDDHPEVCHEGEMPGDYHAHMGALCCPGCLCGSFEATHPGVEDDDS